MWFRLELSMYTNASLYRAIQHRPSSATQALWFSWRYI